MERLWSLLHYQEKGECGSRHQLRTPGVYLHAWTNRIKKKLLLLQVKYYNAENYEVGRFEDAILKYQVGTSLVQHPAASNTLFDALVTPSWHLIIF